MSIQNLTKLALLVSIFINHFALALDIEGTIDANSPLWQKLQDKDNINNIDVLLKANVLIIHGEKPFHLYARRLDVENGAKIVAFKQAAQTGNGGTGVNGKSGKSGKRGLNAGQVTIEAIEAYGELGIDNKGQNGGHGGNGGKGVTGSPSYDCVKRAEKCKRIERTKIVYTYCDPNACVEHQWRCPIPTGQGFNAGQGGTGGTYVFSGATLVG
jgi:hypothetical protein